MSYLTQESFSVLNVSIRMGTDCVAPSLFRASTVSLRTVTFLSFRRECRYAAVFSSPQNPSVQTAFCFTCGCLFLRSFRRGNTVYLRGSTIIAEAAFLALSEISYAVFCLKKKTYNI